MTKLSRLLQPANPSPTAWALLITAALATGVGGYFHEHLYHEGYSEVWVVGVLFLVNAIGSAVVIVTLIMRRVVLFVLGALSISVGSLVSILISHSTSFIGFAEHKFDTRAVVIVVAEIIATVLVLAAVGIERGGLLAKPETAR